MSADSPDTQSPAPPAPPATLLRAEKASPRHDALRAVIALDNAACPHCAYSLRGLAVAGVAPSRCPECGGGLTAGLIGTVGPRVLRRLMTLMFAWVAFAGVMNGTRQWLFIQDFYLALRARAPLVTTFVGGTPIPRGGWGAVRVAEWVSLGGWSALGVAGIIGIIATARLKRARPRAEKRLVLLLIVCFLLYWGYHGVMFVSELMERF